MRTTKNKKIYEKIAINNNISPQVVKNIYESMFRFIQNRVREVDNLDTKTEEEFKELRLNFNVPLLGKFYINHASIQRLKNKKQYYYEHIKNKEDQTTV